MYCDIEQAACRVSPAKIFIKGALSLMACCYVVKCMQVGEAYPDFIDPVIQGAQLISVFVEDGLLQLLVLKQNLHVHAAPGLQYKHMHIYTDGRTFSPAKDGSRLSRFEGRWLICMHFSSAETA